MVVKMIPKLIGKQYLLVTDQFRYFEGLRVLKEEKLTKMLQFLL